MSRTFKITFLLLLTTASLTAQETATPVVVHITETVEAIAPDSWQAKQPRSRMLAHEFAVSGDEGNIRITMMRAGGGVQANIDRWVGQFKQPDGKATKELAKVDKMEVADIQVHLVDISGTYKDSPMGPRGPSEDKADYRMLGAIFETGSSPYFVKFYGPKSLVDKHEQSFTDFIGSTSNED